MTLSLAFIKNKPTVPAVYWERKTSGNDRIHPATTADKVVVGGSGDYSETFTFAVAGSKGRILMVVLVLPPGIHHRFCKTTPDLYVSLIQTPVLFSGSLKTAVMLTL